MSLIALQTLLQAVEELEASLVRREGELAAAEGRLQSRMDVELSAQRHHYEMQLRSRDQSIARFRQELHALQQELQYLYAEASQHDDAPLPDAGTQPGAELWAGYPSGASNRHHDIQDIAYGGRPSARSGQSAHPTPSKQIYPWTQPGQGDHALPYQESGPGDIADALLNSRRGRASR